MKTISFFRVALLSLIVMLVSCSKDDSIQDLTKADLVGTWKTEYFEYSKMRGPLTATLKNDNSYELQYYLQFEEGDNLWTFEESGTYQLSGNKLIFNSEYNFDLEIEIEKFKGDTAMFGIYNDEISLSVKATKQD